MKYSLTLLLLSSTLLASIGEVTAIRGSADITRGSEHIPVHKGTKLEKHDKIATAKNSRLQILFNDKTVISLGQESRFRIDSYLYEDKNVEARFTVNRGFFKSITGKIGKIAPSHFKVKTANATIGVRGTTIVGEVSPDLDIIACTSGQIVVTSAQGSVIVNRGERTVVGRDGAPRKAQKVNRIILRQLEKASDPAASPVPVTVQPPHETPQQTVPKKITEEEKEAEKSSQIITETPEQATTTREAIQQAVGTQRPVYEGKVVEGTTSYGAIRQDDHNYVRLGFDLGDGSMQGKMQFQDNIQQYDIDVGGKLKEDATFDFNSQNGYNGGGHGELTGEQYDKASGDFHFEEEDLFSQHVNKIDGKFEAEKQ